MKEAVLWTIMLWCREKEMCLGCWVDVTEGS